MSLEEEIAKNTAALEANTAALKAAAGGAAGGGTTTTGGKKTEPKKAETKTEPKRSVEEVKKAAGALSTKKGQDVAKGVIASLGAKALADILGDPSKLDAAYDAFVAETEKEDDDGTGGL